MKKQHTTWKILPYALACSMVLIAQASPASDRFPDTLSKEDQERAYQIDQQIDAQGLGSPMYAMKLQSECALTKDAVPPRNAVEQAEMDVAAEHIGFAGCRLWLGRKSPLPADYKPPKGLTPKEARMSAEERIVACRAMALQIMAKQRRLGDQCAHLPQLTTSSAAAPRGKANSHGHGF